ncbi:hypothetical protein E2C01_079073 [Portunus trituberculatus]|uniref:Uncharacterized protein n=1 Tax=Portunus trituberculatus TaxID=210409 RepID=A0A5B7IRT8_PORTR|nr:hypothetical protein [Portunus trituberculatus]
MSLEDREDGHTSTQMSSAPNTTRLVQWSWGNEHRLDLACVQLGITLDKTQVTAAGLADFVIYSLILLPLNITFLPRGARGTTKKRKEPRSAPD